MQGLSEYLSRLSDNEVDRMCGDRQYRSECIRKYKRSIRKMRGGAAHSSIPNKIGELPEDIAVIKENVIKYLTIDLTDAEDDWYTKTVDICFVNTTTFGMWMIDHLPPKLKDSDMLRGIIPFKGFMYNIERREVKEDTESQIQCGLFNLGNSCYQNSLFQCLFNTALLTSFLVDGVVKFENCWEEITTLELAAYISNENHFFLYYINLFRIYHNNNCKWALTLAEFRKLYPGGLKGAFTGCLQQDVQEFVTAFLNEMDESIRKPTTVVEEKPDNVTGPKPKYFKLMLARQLKYTKIHSFYEKNYTILQFFTSTVLTLNICPTTTCKSIKIKTDSQALIFLDLPEDDTTFVDVLTNSTFNKEVLGADNAIPCEHCKKRLQFHKHRRIYNYPPILLFSLKRFDYVTIPSTTKRIAIKIEVDVVMPDTIDKGGLSSIQEAKNTEYEIPEYIVNKSPKYELYAISLHVGGTKGGHYTAACKRNGSWRLYDDTVVTDATKSDLDTYLKKGYLYFYKRVFYERV